MEGQRTAEGDGGLAGQTDDGQAVGAVGGDLKLHHSIGKIQSLADIHTDLVGILLVQDQNTIGLLAGAVMLGQIHLTEGAEHTVGGNAAELAGLDGDIAGEVSHGQSGGNDSALKDVLGAGDDLLDALGGSTAVHLADEEVIGIGVTLHLDDAGHHHVDDILTQYLIALHLGAGVGQLFAVVADGNVLYVDVIRKPVHRKIHCILPSFKTYLF